MIISIHEYELKPGIPVGDFEAAIAEAEARDLFDLPGLVDHYFLRGMRGARVGRYSAVWVYTSQGAWENLWGPPELPNPPERYPQKWLTWEEEYLAPYLVSEPDEINYTSYRVIKADR